jgi:nucleotide-binding universal stress UspA family protein
MFLGSTAEHLLRHPPAPLVIATTSRPARSVLVCTDGSSNAQRAVETFAELPLTAAAEHVTVLGVASVGIYDDRNIVFNGVDAACESLKDLDPEAVRVESDGNVAGVVLDQAFALRAQLVVIGTRGLTGLRRVLLGSVANAIAHAAPCSVLLVPDTTTGTEC